LKVPLSKKSRRTGDEVAAQIEAARREQWERLTDAERQASEDVALNELARLVSASLPIMECELHKAKSPGETLSVVQTIFACYGELSGVSLRARGVKDGEPVPAKLMRRAEERLADLAEMVAEFAPAAADAGPPAVAP